MGGHRSSTTQANATTVVDIGDDIAVLQADDQAWRVRDEKAGILVVEHMDVEPSHHPTKLSNRCGIESVAEPFRLLLAAELSHPRPVATKPQQS